jgi:hypothetical protein
MHWRFSGVATACFFLLGLCIPVTALADCTNPANAIERENCMQGSPDTEWDINGAGDASIQGFATDISVNAGQTISFKIQTNATRYHFDIYRLGYYGGNGARRVAQNLTPSATLPQTQPSCLTDASLGFMDCGNWAVSASWTVPSTATSGIYLAHVIRDDTGGDSHIVFIVRNDASHSDVLFQTSDETWQAYNDYGGHSLYGPAGEFDITHRAYKVSYNRPFDTRAFENASWLFYAEYPMVRWLEANGYDVTYFTSVDAARNGSLIKNHKLYLSVGHDEYASGPKRTSIEAARDAGVNLAFFSGNEFFWKTRWENSTDGSNTPYRTLACYKETLANAVIDPQDPPTWTGTWRDPRFSPPADGGRPENALTGTWFRVNGFGNDNNALSIQIPAADGKMRFWRNTPVATQSPSSQPWSLPGGTLGYEWDVDEDNGARPAGIIRTATATYSLTTDYLLDFGGTYGGGTATHHMTVYRAPSGALVFGAGTIQWSWGLDANHDTLYYSGFPADSNMQQATVNLFADMSVQPVTLQPGLVPATKSTDTTPPQSTITSPSSGSTVQAGTTVTVTGTAADSGGGVVGGVEVSVDGGQTWHPANGRESWSYVWNPGKAGTVNLKSRAVDDSGNLETPSTGISVLAAAHDCPCTIWSASTTPATVDSADSNAGEFGVRFTADYDGYITGIRFYKASTNNGTHIGHLWTNTGALLAFATFTSESSSGWQQVNFSNPVPVTANTVYVASYFTSSGHYSGDTGYFNNSYDDAPLHALQNGASGTNGVFSYGSGGQFPTSTFGSSNYWVDVVYLPGSSMPGAPPSLLATPSGLSFTAYTNEPAPPAQNVNIYNQGTAALAWSASSNASWIVLPATSGTTPTTLAVSVNQSGLAAGTYTGTITISSSAGTQTVSVTMTVSTLLASEDFTSGNLQGWIPSSIGSLSGWSFVSGGLRYSGAGMNQLYAGDTSWTDYTVQVQLEVDSLNNYPGGIRGRVNPGTGAGYLVWIYPGNSNVRLFKATGWNINNGLTELAGSPGVAGITAGGLHTVALSFHGSQIQVLFDGNVVITANDSTYASGLVALDVFNQPITYKNLLITVPTANPANITLSQSSLSFTGNVQGPSPAPQSVQVTTTGTGPLAWTASSNAAWLTASPSSSMTPGTLQISANTSQLAAGTYSGTILLTSLGAGNSPAAINVTLNVVTPPPAIVLSPTSMSFVAVTGQPAPAAQALSIVNGGLGSFSWSASSDSSWLTVSAASGTTPSTVNIAVNQTGLAPGTYNGNITISAAGIPNSPQTVPVTLSVLTPDMTENFSDMARGWIFSPLGLASGWSVSNGVYSFNGSGLSLSCAGNSGWTDYDFDTNIKLANLNNWPGGVRGRVNPSNGAGYAVWLYPGSGIAVLYRVPGWDINGSGLTTLATANLSFDASASHDLKMSFRGSQISVLWDGQLLMTATDRTFASGFVCMDADNQPISYSNVRVASTVAAATLDTPAPLTFSALPGAQPPAQTVNITAGGQVTSWTATSNASWLQVTTSSTLTPGTITASVNTSGLAEGTYNGSITIYAPGATNSPLVVPVTLAIKTAVLATAPASLTFFGASGYSTPGQNISITNSGTGVLSWSATADSSWITMSATSGSAPSSTSVSPNETGLAAGSYSGNITITSPDVGNGPAVIPVSLQIGNLAFLDDFTSGAGNWTISPVGNASGWSVAANAYSFNGQGPSQAWAGNPSWTNYVMSVDFKLSSTNNFPGGIRGRVNTTTGAAYGVWIYPSTGLVRLWRMTQWNIDTDSGLTLLGQPASAVIDTNAHNLKLEFVGQQISVYYDDRLLIQATDSTYTQGAVALEVHDQPVTFNKVAVISF